MAKTPKQSSHPKPRQIIGLSLAPELAREFKLHAAKRDVSLKVLFEEMWRLYQKKA